MIARIVLVLAALAAAGACRSEGGAATVGGEASRSAAGLQVIPLTIASSGGTHRFQVEVAATPEQQSRGMMFREQIGPFEGMLFPHDPPRMASFWMKNTLIPLDIIFIRPDGTISSIAVNAVPQSLDQINSVEPAAAVLEVGGGRTLELGVAEGDKVSWDQASIEGTAS